MEKKIHCTNYFQKCSWYLIGFMEIFIYFLKSYKTNIKLLKHVIDKYNLLNWESN